MPCQSVSPASSPRRPGAGPATAFLLVPLVVGCSAWTPWTSSDKAARNAELYGPTANQRIKALQEEAKRVHGEDDTRRVEFTRGLVDRMLGEHDARVRCEILAVAGGFDTASAVAICRGALQDPDDRVRMKACDVWRDRGGAEAVQMLANRYRADRELDVRLTAVRMLGELRDEAAIPVLAEALENPDPAVQYRAVAALKRVSGRDLGNDVNAWREWAANPARDDTWSIAEAFRRLF
ncbi:MAG: HEAT repeat domain-containing protein [Planctomycetia bacterium]|nr:HEAT repeat domain-containing protein [Planctomycetia bacterium]